MTMAKAKKESSPKASTIAGRMLRELNAWTLQDKQDYCVVKVEELKTICASVLAQDETKGQKKRKAKR